MDQHSIGSSALESRVLIIMTGGTICMKRSPNGFVPARGFLESGMAPRPSFNDFSNPDDIVIVVDDGTEVSHRSLRTPVSTYQKHVRYAVFEFQELLDSSSISSEGWSQIAQTIFRNYKLFDAFVILHGTDSLAYTCSALSFMLQNLGKPVILTGSQAPMLELQNDATDNLLGSLIIAGHFMIPEVCLFFNYNLFRGNRTTKVSASDFSAFASPNAPPLYVHLGDDPAHLVPRLSCETCFGRNFTFLLPRPVLQLQSLPRTSNADSVICVEELSHHSRPT